MAVAQFFRCLQRLFPHLIEFLARLFHFRSAFRLRQLFIQIIKPPQQIFLLFLQALELIVQFLLLRLAAGLSHLLAQLLHLLGQRLLTAGQFLQLVQDFQALLLLRRLLGLRGFLLFVALLLLLQLQIHQLIILLLR